jgi:hypothetical protein
MTQKTKFGTKCVQNLLAVYGIHIYIFLVTTVTFSIFMYIWVPSFNMCKEQRPWFRILDTLSFMDQVVSLILTPNLEDHSSAFMSPETGWPSLGISGALLSVLTQWASEVSETKELEKFSGRPSAVEGQGKGGQGPFWAAEPLIMMAGQRFPNFYSLRPSPWNFSWTSRPLPPE